MLRNFFNRRGQVSMLFALLMPIFILIIGLVLDLGWYYLNVSRLQNAADAAAVAGAQSLVSSENFSTYNNISLVRRYPGKISNEYRTTDIYELTTIENGKLTAEKYIDKNLTKNSGSKIDSWTKAEFQAEQGLYEKDDNLYYVVRLKEEIRHFFLPGWFDDMSAPVTAVALLSKRETIVSPTTRVEVSPEELESASRNPKLDQLPEDPDEVIISEEFWHKLERARNRNALVGNWEVQAYYTVNNTPFEDPVTGELVTSFYQHFGYYLYSSAWNHFQDPYHHYDSGEFFRKQTVTILDDVEFTTDNDGKETVTSFGERSSVVQTKAAKNNDKESSAYNPEGKPYPYTKLDSINIDFRPEVTLSNKWLSQDWDLILGQNNVTPQNKDWVSINSLTDEKIKALRIHSSMNFDGAYKVRPDKHSVDSPDILWMRIESEPMLYHPDATTDEVLNKYYPNNSNGNLNKPGLNSINQIIINANYSNYDTVAQAYRPVIIFYDGPETYDTYDSYKSRTDVFHRKSLPVILNLNAPFRGVLYAPNCPVVVIGNNKDAFKGFVVAKEYMRLKDDSDFEDAGYKYFNNAGRQTEHAEPQEGDFKIQVYKAKDDGTICYKTIDENGIPMYVDVEHGDIQFATMDDPPKKYGSYDNFGRTDFTSHGYEVYQTSANNMFIAPSKDS